MGRNKEKIVMLHFEVLAHELKVKHMKSSCVRSERNWLTCQAFR